LQGKALEHFILTENTGFLRIQTENLWQDNATLSSFVLAMLNSMVSCWH